MNLEDIALGLEERITRLERANRLLFLVICIMGTMLAAILIIAAAPVDSQTQDVVKAKCLEIIGDDGSAIIEMLDDDTFGPIIRVYNSEGNLAAVLDADSAGYGGSLRLHGLSGINVMEIGGVRGWGPGFSLCNENGVRRATLRLTGSDRPRLSFYSGELDDERTRISIGLINGDKPELALYGPDNEILFYEPEENLVEELD